MLEGSCACGQIRYEIQGGLIGPITYCHCWRCRKHSGSSFGTTAGMQPGAFRITAGEQLLSSWESSPGIHRHFASCCGSPIYKQEKNDPNEIYIRLGTLDTDPEVVVDVHYAVGSKAPWVVIEDSISQEPGGAPFGEKD
jgi:hypothetical protein